MHSPIIYLLEKGTDYVDSLEGFLPSEYEIDEETLFDYIDESDWLVANTLKESNWHRNQWNEEFDSMFKDNPYISYSKEGNNMVLTITHENLIKWDKRVLELNGKYNDVIKENLKNNKFTDSLPFNIFQEYFEYKDMVLDEYGGIRFAVLGDFENCGELEFYHIYSLKELVDDAKRKISIKRKSAIKYQVCTNVVGDYHY
ncbi:hypothetical protein [Staphylococcus gallinarum]|uniref:hypothetical protein n=1 Tax=Staphylococcus gallinarum TaxID=1293 RepID=UPI001E2C5954|nr:hypothetical protein [Staphylococcus gallinarum]MCD8845217.1 hypothetical protein [Staphylococcus gallinarum]